MEDTKVSRVKKFKYLGSTVQKSVSCEKEVKTRVQAGWNGWRKVSGVICDRQFITKLITKAGRCLNCLRKHLVKNCLFPNKCRTYGAACSQKRFFLLHESYVTSPESRKVVDRETEVAGSVPARKVNIASVEAALNRVTTVRLINPDNGKSKLVYCQHVNRFTVDLCF